MSMCFTLLLYTLFFISLFSKCFFSLSQTLTYFFLIRLRLEDFNLVNLGRCKLKMYVFFKRFCLFVSLISWKEESQKTIWSNCFHFVFFWAHEIKWVVPDWPNPQLLIAHGHLHSHDWRQPLLGAWVRGRFGRFDWGYELIDLCWVETLGVGVWWVNKCSWYSGWFGQ